MIILRQKFFSDRNSDWWKKKIAEERKRDPNSPRIKKWESVLQYTLEEEGKADPKKAEEAASRKSQGHSAYSGSSRKTSSFWDDFNKEWEDLHKKWQEEDRQREQQKQSAKKEYKEGSEKIKEDVRRRFNKKNYTGGYSKNFRRNATVMAGVAGASAAYGAYKSKKSRDEWKEKQKSYSSQKKDDKYYQGEETDYQKMNRKAGSRIIAGVGTASGGLLGSIMADSKVDDARNRVDRASREEGYMRDAFVDNLGWDKRRHIIDEKFNDDIKAIDANINYHRRMRKLSNKAVKRGALKGAAVGGAISGLGAYAYNNSAKTRNEKTNVKRRTRPDNKKKN